MDDSIVRGTTIANLIHMLKEAGAKEVHVRISSPPFYIHAISERMCRQMISSLQPATARRKSVK